MVPALTFVIRNSAIFEGELNSVPLLSLLNIYIKFLLNITAQFRPGYTEFTAAAKTHCY